MHVAAEYTCCLCLYMYKGPPGPTTCPHCASVYVKWVNYEEWSKLNPLPPLVDRRSVAARLADTMLDAMEKR